MCQILYEREREREGESKGGVREKSGRKARKEEVGREEEGRECERE